MELELKGIGKIYNKDKKALNNIALNNIDLKLTEGVYGLSIQTIVRKKV